MGFRANAKIIREKTSPGSRGRWEPEARLGSLKWQGAGKGGTKWPNIRLRDRRALIVDDEALIAMALATATRIGVAVVNGSRRPSMDLADKAGVARTSSSKVARTAVKAANKPKARVVAAAAARRKSARRIPIIRPAGTRPTLEAASHEAVRSKTQRRLAPSQTALLRYQGLAAIMWFRATLGATSSKFQIRAMARASTR